MRLHWLRHQPGTAAAGAFVPIDGVKLLKRRIEVVIDEQMMVFLATGDFVAGRCQPLGDGLVALVVAAAETVFQLAQRRRQEENADQLVRMTGRELAVALHVENQKEINTLCKQSLGGPALRTVAVAVHFCVFEKVAPAERGEALISHEDVVPALHFMRSWRPGRYGHEAGKIPTWAGVAGKQSPGKRRLPGPRWPRYDKQQTPRTFSCVCQWDGGGSGVVRQTVFGHGRYGSAALAICQCAAQFAFSALGEVNSFGSKAC
jgi:hypothetical protein